MITGNKLIIWGYKPGKWFKAALEHINANNLSDGDAIEYLNTVAPADPIPLHPEPVKYHKNIKAETPEEIANVEQVYKTMDIIMRTPTVVAGSVMPDACPSGPLGTIPVGGVAVSENAIHPGWHSADICCSVALTMIGKVDPKLVLDAAHAATHFGPGGREDHFDLPEDLKLAIALNPFTNSPKSIELSRTHLGTQGDGNHFLFVGISKVTGETCIVTHHGSRGFGAQLYKEGLKVAERYRRELSPETLPVNAWIPYDTADGKNYWDALDCVRYWTKLNHFLLHEKICAGLEVKSPTVRFWNEHNFVFRDGTRFYHGKGATPIRDSFVPDQINSLRLIPLNMAQPILVVSGKPSDTNLGFAPHGAGRNISRAQHVRNNSEETIEAIFERETSGLDIRFFSKNIDISELPSAYKDSESVKSQMQEFGLGYVMDEIQPYGSIMAGDFEKDAFWRKRKEARKNEK